MIDTSGINSADQLAELVRDAVSRAFEAESRSRLRDPHHLGISGLGRCTRAAAHALARTDPSDSVNPREGRAANLGTWEHNGLLPRLCEQIQGATHEREVTLRAGGVVVRGRVDMPAPDVVLDLKTVGEYRLQQIRRSGAVLSHLIQTAGYGVALLQTGIPVRWLVLLYMDRANGDVEPIVIPFTNRLALMAIGRVAALAQHAENPDEAPQVDAGGAKLHGPDLEFECRECPWMRRCWGDGASADSPPEREFSDHDVERLLVDYDAARAVEKAAKSQKDQILRLLDGTPRGVYGVVRYARSSDIRVDDGSAALRMLRELGIEIPQKLRKGPARITLVAKR